MTEGSTLANRPLRLLRGQSIDGSHEVWIPVRDPLDEHGHVLAADIVPGMPDLAAAHVHVVKVEDGVEGRGRSLNDPEERIRAPVVTFGHGIEDLIPVGGQRQLRSC